MRRCFLFVLFTAACCVCFFPSFAGAEQRGDIILDAEQVI